MGRYEQKRAAPARKKSLTPARRRRRRRILSVVGILTLSLCIWLGIYLSTPPAQVEPPPAEPQDDVTADNTSPPDTDAPDISTPTRSRKKNFYTMLLVGTMDDYNTDTIMLASVDTEADIVNVISIPRDTMVDIEERNMKINGAYGRDGIEELCREVQDITDIYPDFYCVVNVASFVKIVDLFGGVEFEVPYDMYHPDADSQYTINLRKGLQTLDGKNRCW